MEIIISREGGGGTTAPLFFNGACDYFRELPLPNDKTNLDKVYHMIDNIRNVKSNIAMMNININNNLKTNNLWQKLWAYLVCLAKEKLQVQ